MFLRHILVLAALSLILFLGMYSWNKSTHVLDEIAVNTGMEAGGGVLGVMRAIQDAFSHYWDMYFDLVGVREEMSV